MTSQPADRSGQQRALVRRGWADRDRVGARAAGWSRTCGRRPQHTGHAGRHVGGRGGRRPGRHRGHRRRTRHPVRTCPDRTVACPSAPDDLARRRSRVAWQPGTPRCTGRPDGAASITSCLRGTAARGDPRADRRRRLAGRRHPHHRGQRSVGTPRRLRSHFGRGPRRRRGELRGAHRHAASHDRAPRIARRALRSDPTRPIPADGPLPPAPASGRPLRPYGTWTSGAPLRPPPTRGHDPSGTPGRSSHKRLDHRP